MAEDILTKVIEDRIQQVFDTSLVKLIDDRVQEGVQVLKDVQFADLFAKCHPERPAYKPGAFACVPCYDDARARKIAIPKDHSQVRPVKAKPKPKPVPQNICIRKNCNNERPAKSPKYCDKCSEEGQIIYNRDGATAYSKWKKEFLQ